MLYLCMHLFSPSRIFLNYWTAGTCRTVFSRLSLFSVVLDSRRVRRPCVPCENIVLRMPKQGQLYGLNSKTYFIISLATCTLFSQKYHVPCMSMNFPGTVAASRAPARPDRVLKNKPASTHRTAPPNPRNIYIPSTRFISPSMRTV